MLNRLKQSIASAKVGSYPRPCPRDHMYPHPREYMLTVLRLSRSLRCF